ncbi:MAG: hypothetical protein JWM59_1523 [Verrucomicrobiales bacterium]|nr:hypothetical protein [Verrucomicrobiales bacterium]
MKHLYPSTILLTVLSLLPGCSRGPGSVPSAGGWIIKLSALPPHVRQHLLETFDTAKTSRREHTGFPQLKGDTITDNPRKFDAGCVIQEGFSQTLFIRAKEVAGSWVVEYEEGGPSRGKAALVLSPDKAGILHREVPAAIGLSPPDAETAVSLLQRRRVLP